MFHVPFSTYFYPPLHHYVIIAMSLLWLSSSTCTAHYSTLSSVNSVVAMADSWKYVAQRHLASYLPKIGCFFQSFCMWKHALLRVVPDHYSCDRLARENSPILSHAQVMIITAYRTHTHMFVLPRVLYAWVVIMSIYVHTFHAWVKILVLFCILCQGCLNTLPLQIHH